MSVLVKGMKMPTECEYCGFCRYYPENGNVWCNANNRLLKQQWKEPHWTHLDVKRPEWCPLIELPEKHGQLVDVDDLIADYDRVHVGEPGAARILMENASTIIEAEGDEE